MFTAKPSQPALTSLSLKLNRTSKEKKLTKQNQQKKYNVLLEIERRRCYVTLPWQQNFSITTNLGPANMAGKKMVCVNFGGMIALMIRNRTAAHRLFVSRSKMKMTVIVEIQKFCFHGNVAFLLSLREGSIRVGNQRKLTTCTEI